MDQAVVLLVIASFLRFLYPTQGGTDPCTNSKVLPDLTQRVDGYEVTEAEPMICDYFLSRQWYSLGHYVLANANAKCGTGIGWFMKDPLPPQGHAYVTVCKHQGTDNTPCLHNKTAEVKLCNNGNYVFYLNALDVCNEAYCIRNKDKGEIEKAPPDVSSLNKPKIRVDVAKQGNEYQLMFYCDIVPIKNKDYFYVVEWSLGWSNLARLIKSSSEEKFTNETEFLSKTLLTEKDLYNFGIRTLGFSVICSVKAKQDIAGAFSQVISSDPKFCGLERKEVGEVNLANSKAVHLRLTVPFGCNRNRCELIFTIFVTTTKSCQLSQVTIANSKKLPCGISFSNSEINIYKEVNVFSRSGFSTLVGNKEDNHRVIQLVSMNFPDHKIFGDYAIAPIMVYIQNEYQSISSKRCYAHSDPHITTFDGLGYEHQFEGTFILYKHKTKNTEMQIKTRKCSNNRDVYCICGFVIRAGRDIFLSDKCDKRSIQEPSIALCDDNLLGEKIQRETDRPKYIITLPTGTVVEIFYSNWGNWMEFFDVDIMPSHADMNKIEGICGNFDNEANNDKQSNTPKAAWSVRSSDDLFDQDNYANLSSFADEVYLCTCPYTGLHIHNEIACDTSQQNHCDYDSRVKVDKHRLCNKQRKKRSLQNIIHRDIDTHYTSKLSLSPFQMKRSIYSRKARSTNVYTKVNARKECVQLMNTTIVNMCSGLPNLNIDSYIDNCVADAVATNSMDWTKIHLEGFKSKCIYDIRANQPLSEDALEELKQVRKNVEDANNLLNNTSEMYRYENVTDELFLYANNSHDGKSDTLIFTPELLESVISIGCPFDCNARGKCIKGKCVCDSNFIGFDCSVDADKPPEIIGIPDNGMCDQTEELCAETSIFAGSLVESPALSCRLEPFTVGINGTVSTNKSMTVSAKMETYTEISCNLPPTRSRRSPKMLNDRIAYGYYISVSNDGKLFSEEDTLVIFDSNCVDCTKHGQQIQCAVKPGFCVTDGLCYKKSESIGCMTCADDLHRSLKWIHIIGCDIKSKGENEISNQKLWIIGAVLGPIICIIIISIFACRKHRTTKKEERQKAAYCHNTYDVSSKQETQ